MLIIDEFSKYIPKVIESAQYKGNEGNFRKEMQFHKT